MRRFFCFNFLGDFYQAVLLFSLRELDFPVNHVGSRKLSVFVADDFVVDFEAIFSIMSIFLIFVIVGLFSFCHCRA